MSQQWQIESLSGRCATTGRRLEEGEEFYTVLFDDGDSFRRVDYSLEAWKGMPEGAFSHFRTRVPIKQKRRKLLVDNEILVSFFTRLADQAEPLRVQFRFVLALILLRKRLLRYEGTATDEGREIWRMTLAIDKTSHQVINPRLTEDQIQEVSSQLSAILHGDMGKWAGHEDLSEPISGPDDQGESQEAASEAQGQP